MPKHFAVRDDDGRHFNHNPKNLGRYNQHKPIMDRLVSRSENYGNPGCWLWIGFKDRNGYGRIQLSKDGRVRTAFVHRVAFSIYNPLWDKSNCVLHRCDVPSCWNPDHLFAGSQADNMADMKSKGRASNGDTSGENNGRAKLTWKTVRQIRSAWLRGHSREYLVDRFSTPRYTINSIIGNKTWKEK